MQTGYKYINLLATASSDFRQIARHSGYMHSLVMVAIIRNERDKPQTLKAGGCQLIFCKTGVTGDVTRTIGGTNYPAFYCSALVQNPNLDSRIYNIGNLNSEITVPANGSVNLGFVVDLPWDKMNALFPYNESQPTNTPTNFPILLSLSEKGKPFIGTKVNATTYNYTETLNSYQYYWRISQ